ncbi:MAG TPA: efflux RND transporter periplasmic adaptor subunit, partial [Anaerolineales bacterium]|nr:efflux RND transporter periplasmic adaptor subunit [Anaerolineales bacterium]
GVFALPLAQGPIVASAVFVPAQVSKLGFVASGLVKEVLAKEGDSVKAGDVLIALDAPELQFTVTAAEAALRSAQINAELQRYGRIKEQRNGKIFWTQLPKEYIEIADIQVKQAQAALEIAQAALAQTSLAAPFEGVVASVDIAQGEFIEQGRVAVTLAALNDLRVETTDLSERDIAKVNVGDSATVFVESLNQTVNGTVIAISPVANTVGGDVVFKVAIELDEQVQGLLWGMTAEVTIGEQVAREQ